MVTSTIAPGAAALRALMLSKEGTAGAGHAVRVLRNASENYPAWLDALGAAKQRVCFENYIVSNDATGRRFAIALAERARRGARVRVLYDWLGCLGEGAGRILRHVAAAGAEVRAFNPPRLDRPLAWLTRDHRKAIAIDGQVAFVSGLCVSDRCGARLWSARAPGRHVTDASEAARARWSARSVSERGAAGPSISASPASMRGRTTSSV
jgi:phosphatidylserine/phosphatidylglycerophosphate/cardiolipin synthase-like enzyme